MKRNSTSASSSYSSSLIVGPSSRDKSLGTHCTCSSSFPTSKGIASAVLVYCKTAPAIRPLSITLLSTPEGSVKDKEEDRSNTGFVGVRVDHSYDVCEAFDETAEGKVLLLWDGTNDQDVCGGAYASLSDDDEDALIVSLGSQGQNGGIVTVSDWTSDQLSQLFTLVYLQAPEAILSCPSFHVGGNRFLRTNLQSKSQEVGLNTPIHPATIRLHPLKIIHTKNR